jgi:hypothetical protein
MGPIEPAAVAAATLLATNALEASGGRAGEPTWAGMSPLVTLVRDQVLGHRGPASACHIQHHPRPPARSCASERTHDALLSSKKRLRA